MGLGGVKASIGVETGVVAGIKGAGETGMVGGW